jgi:hypothetical protein
MTRRLALGAGRPFNLATVLRHAGSGLEHIVKVTILVIDMAVIDQPD